MNYAHLKIFLEKDYALGFSHNMFSIIIGATVLSCNRYRNMVCVLYVERGTPEQFHQRETLFRVLHNRACGDFVQ